MTQPIASTPCDVLVNRGGWAEDLALHRCEFPIGPRNTWSNAAYALVGIATGLVIGSWTAWAFALAMTMLAVGSGLYHGTKTLLANRLDWFGMYAVFGALVIHGLIPNGWVAALLMALAAGSVGAYFSLELAQFDLNGQIGLLLALSAIPAVAYGTLSTAIESMVFFLVAYGVWQLDVHRSKLTGLWGHAVWHILTAVAFVFMFLAQVR